MRILHISDTHGRHHLLHDLPPADVIVHSGDLTDDGQDEEVVDFVEWFANLDYTHKLFIPGNHDTNLYKASLDGLPDDMHFLYNSGITINGIHFYGVPYFVPDITSGNFIHMVNAIPSTTNVLITHLPPLGMLDKASIHESSFELLNKVYEVKPRLHLFGHSHKDEGIEVIDGITFSNAAMGEKGKMNVEHVFEI